MQQPPKFLNGDMVYSEFGLDGGVAFFEFAPIERETGIVISVQHSNGKLRASDEYPYVYYVFFERGVVGPLWQSQIKALQ